LGATDTSNAAARADAPLTRAEAVRLAQGYVAAYNNRDLDAMLALQDENIVSYPSRLFGHQPSPGHAGVRAWWASMVAAGRWYHVVIRIRSGLIIESHSYLSDVGLLDGVLR
jgi:hypothetical protein